MNSKYHIPFLTQETAPVSEPLILAEAKLYLRVDGVEEDTVITRMIAAARKAAEKYMRRSLITQSWKLSYDNYAPSEIFLPRGPIQSVSSVKIIARDSTETAIAASKYFLSSGKEKLVLDFAPLGHAVEIVYVAGFGDSTDVPDDIRQGMLAHVAGLYDNRHDTALKKSMMSLYDSHRAVML